MLNLEHTYLELPQPFYTRINPHALPKKKWVLYNEELEFALFPKTLSPKERLELCSGTLKECEGHIFAQAYAGHQFGNFTMLGDGRTAVLGEFLHQGQRYDLQLKGSGTTPYSRRGDGSATLSAMLREYMMSEAMHHLGIPTSRSLGILLTGEPVQREKTHPGAVLTRIMKSHIRIGTFEYARYFLDIESLDALLNYSVKRHYPQLVDSTNKIEEFILSVAKAQFQLVAHWMSVGFVHGVMNTDNTSISGETFDYGPCAFINQFKRNACFSSIDLQGRYAYDQQGLIVQWNLTRLTEALLPLIDKNEEKALKKGQEIVQQFQRLWQEEYYSTMVRKIGFQQKSEASKILIDQFLLLLEKEKVDFTLGFSNLCRTVNDDDFCLQSSPMKRWMDAWTIELARQGINQEAAELTMRNANPARVPRNKFVEELLEECEKQEGIGTAFHLFLEAIREPYQASEKYDKMLNPPDGDFDLHYKTFCGT